jgi:hypothetical protein
LTHAAALIHVPVASQLCGFNPLHCLAPGLHVPEQAPPLHTLVQVVPLIHVPVASQVCGVSPLHCLAPGVQTPEHTPLMQAEETQATAPLHWPLVEHVSTPFW